MSRLIEKEMIVRNLSMDVGYKPFHYQDLKSKLTPDSIFLDHLLTGESKSWFYRKLRIEHFASVNEPNFMLNLDILFDFQIGSDMKNQRTLYRNTRAGKIEGQVGNSITFFSTFYENQASFPVYIDSFINEYWIVPGQGVKRDYKETGFDFNWAEGGFLWAPNDLFHFELGHGKKFIGNGYRSLFLSDNAFNFPYFSFLVSNKKIRYVKTVASLMHNIHNVNMGNYLFDRKFFTWHYLNFNMLNGDFQFALFEGNIWKNPDQTGQFDYNPIYLNPVPFINSLTKGNNSIIGCDVALNLFNTMQLYGQVMIDDNVGEKVNTNTRTGFQVGYKYYDPFGVPGLFLLAEYNQVAPYSYAQPNDLMAYSHYNQPLAHPVGANFRESIIQLNYRFRSILLTSQLNIINYGDDSDALYVGRNIINSRYMMTDRNTEFLRGTGTNVKYVSIEFNYILNSLTNMNVSLGYRTRNFSQDDRSLVSNAVVIAFRTSLNNFYYDF